MTTEYEKPTLLESDLAQFHGTTQYYRSPQPWIPFLYTDGVHHLATKAEAYWILDLIGSWQAEAPIRNDSRLQDMQFWTLTVNRDRTAQMRCDRDEGNTAIEQKIEYTDFPLPEIRFYLHHMWCYWQFSGTGPRKTSDYGVLILPSEY
jgi:hypothetical protein